MPVIHQSEIIPGRPGEKWITGLKGFAALTLLLVVNAQAWRSTLHPVSWTAPGPEKSFYTDKVIQDFSYAGYHYGEGLLPNPVGTPFDVTQPPFNADNTGSWDATAAIQSAIDAAGNAGGGVVFMPAGTYNLSPQSGKSSALLMDRSKVVLRGAGTNRTFLLNTETNMRDKEIIRVDGGNEGWTTVPPGSPVAAFTADVMGPSRSIPVADASAFQPGEWVVVRSDITEDWITEHKEPKWIGQGSRLGGLVYLRRIDSVNTVTKRIHIDIPIRYAMKTRDNARIHRAPPMIDEVGVEHFSLGNVQNNKIGWDTHDYTIAGTGGYEAHASYMVLFNGVRNAWIRNIETYRPSQNSSTAHMLSNGLLLNQCRSVTVDSCHFQRPQSGGAGGNGYMYRIQAQENLIRNSRATFSRHGFVFAYMYASGNVFRRCTDKDGGKQTGLIGDMITTNAGSDHHMHFSHSNLFDGSTVENSALLAAYRPHSTHSITSAHSVYWNIQGLGSWSYSIHTQQARYGYAIGTWGQVTEVKTSAVGATEPQTAPIDHVEGVGLGQSLEPQSLYMDQFSRRMAGKPIGVFFPSRHGKAMGTKPILTLAGLQMTVPAGRCVVELYALDGTKLGTLFDGTLVNPKSHVFPLAGIASTDKLALMRINTESESTSTILLVR